MMRTCELNRTLLCLGLALACGFGSSATASPLPRPKPILRVTADSEEIRKARELNEAGIALIDEGQVEKATGFFRRSYEAYPIPSTLFNLAVAQEELGEYQDALSLYLAIREALEQLRKYLTAEKASRDVIRTPEQIAADEALVAQNVLDVEASISTLRAQLSSKLVRTEIEVSPEEAVLQLNGVDVVPLVEGVRELWVQPGSYTLSVVGEGYETVTRDVALSIGPTFRWSVALQRKTSAPPSEGAIEVVANVPGAVAFVSGQRAGTTPVDRYLVQPGTHDVRIEADGHVPFTTRVQVAQGATVRVEANLAVDDGGWSQSDTAWTLVGAGGGIAIAGAIVIGTAIQSAHDANGKKKADQFDSARSQYAAGWALVGVGGAAAITGAVLLLTDGDGGGEGPVISGSPLGNDGAWVGATFRF